MKLEKKGNSESGKIMSKEDKYMGEKKTYFE
jgi:hypothetical protein